MIRSITTLATLLTVTCATAQTTVTIACDRDNTLYESATGSLSNAGGPLFAGVTGGNLKRRALLHFDVAAALPAGAKLLTAKLSLNVTQIASPGPVEMHRALQAWGEGASFAGGGGIGGGGGAGAPATTNDATWLHTFFPGSFWTTPGGDFAPSASFTMVLNLGSNTSPIATGATADVQNWLDNPAQNFGWLVLGNELLPATAARFDSRETTTGVGPTLTVTYLAQGTGGTWGTGCPTPLGNYSFAFAGAPIGGATIAMNQSNGPASAITAHFFSLDLEPVGLPLVPGCTVHLSLPGLISGPIALLSPAGAASLPFGVPAGFPGYLVVCQTVALDNSPLGFEISNAGLICLQ